RAPQVSASHLLLAPCTRGVRRWRARPPLVFGRAFRFAAERRFPMSQPQVPVVALRTAAIWGTTVLVAQHLSPGRSLKVGEGEGAVVAKPDSASVSELPIRAVGNG